MADFCSSSLIIVFRPGGLAESQSPLKTLNTGQFITKKWKVIDGFRSAKFGMNEKQVRRAIIKDFKAPKKFLIRNVDPTNKNTRLIFTVKDLILKGGKRYGLWLFYKWK